MIRSHRPRVPRVVCRRQAQGRWKGRQGYRLAPAASNRPPFGHGRPVCCSVTRTPGRHNTRRRPREGGDPISPPSPRAEPATWGIPAKNCAPACAGATKPDASRFAGADRSPVVPDTTRRPRTRSRAQTQAPRASAGARIPLRDRRRRGIALAANAAERRALRPIYFLLASQIRLRSILPPIAAPCRRAARARRFRSLA